MSEYDSQYVFVSLNTARELSLFGTRRARRGDTPRYYALNARASRSAPAQMPPGSSQKPGRKGPSRSSPRSDRKGRDVFLILLTITVVAAFGIASTLFTAHPKNARGGAAESPEPPPVRLCRSFCCWACWWGLRDAAWSCPRLDCPALPQRSAQLAHPVDWFGTLPGHRFTTFPNFRHGSVPDVLIIAVSALIICALALRLPPIRSGRSNPWKRSATNEAQAALPHE